MTADPTGSPAPRRLADDATGPRPAEAAAPVATAPVAAAPVATAPVAGAEALATDTVAAGGADAVATGAAGAHPATGPIATLVAPPEPVGIVPDDPRTGEPRVPWVVRIASVLSFVAVATIGCSLLWVYWDAVPKDTFARASWLMGQFVTEPGSLGRVLLAVAVTVIALLIAVPLAISGYYAWAGYRWSRVCAAIGAVLSFGALTLNVPAWATIPPAVVAAVLLWLPGSARYFAAWRARRHPEMAFAPPTTNVYYGPLPRYR